MRALLLVAGAKFPDVPVPVVKARGTSKLKKWTCSCLRPVNVRVAVDDFHAKCLRCGGLFRRCD